MKIVLLAIAFLSVSISSFAQITGLKKGTCVSVSGILSKKLKLNQYSVRLDNSEQVEDLVIDLDGNQKVKVSDSISGIFEVIGDKTFVYTDPNGFQSNRLMPVLKNSKRCLLERAEKKRLEDKQLKENEVLGLRKQTFRKD